MTKEDMIYNSILRVEKKIDKHIADKDSHGKGLTTKEWGIIGGIVTVVCTTITGIIGTLVK